ncbi:hypothetical protein BGZ73_008637 [Actinomortierella ambigua]|nr:hypothetical protein BGZ73_008637 [Actinomortierella ambigua]
MNQLLCIPEFVNLISSHLDLVTLSACVRVCKAWHEICIPHLWHTFGAFPEQPVRFGRPHPPEIALPADTTFPLYVSLDNGSADPKTPLFTEARPEIYTRTNKWIGRNFAARTMWDRFFGGGPSGLGEEEAITPIVAKHAKHIRCLVIHSRWAFAICEDVCRQLTSFYYDIVRRDYDMAIADERILSFVEQQPNLQSIYMPQCTTVSKSLLQLNRDWRHFDVVLEAQDFSDIQSLLPHARTVQVKLLGEGDGSRSLRLSSPHLYLRELALHTDHFDYHMLKDILGSFPSLRRLTVASLHNPEKLDLMLDDGYSILFAQGSTLWDISQLIPLLPNLVAFTGVEYHSREFSVLRTTSEKSVSRLLASCRDLVAVYCVPWSMSLEDIISAPWVCHKLKNLHCVFGDVPLLSDAEQECYRSLMNRRRERKIVHKQHSQPDFEWMEENEKAVLRKAELLKTYIESIDAQLQQIPEVNLKPQPVCYHYSRNNSFLQQLEAVKVSIQF